MWFRTLLAVVVLAAHPCLGADQNLGPTKSSMLVDVVDEQTGRALPEATVTVLQKGMSTEPRKVDADGKLALELPASTPGLRLICRAPGRMPVLAQWIGRDGPAVLPTSFTVKLPAGSRIGGRVVDEDGSPVAGAMVRIDDDRGVRYRPDKDHSVAPHISGETITTGPDGRWGWDGAPGGAEADKIRLTVTHPDFVADGSVVRPKTGELHAGTAITTLERGVDIVGRVLDKDGKPVAGAKVRPDRGSASSQTDADGLFFLARQRGGTASVSVVAKGFAPKVERVTIDRDAKPGTAVELVLEPGRPLRGRVLDPSGKPVPRATVSVRPLRGGSRLDWRTTTGEDGRFGMDDAPQAGLSFSVSARGFRTVLGTTLEPSDDGEEVVTLRPNLVAHGSVSDALTKRPIEEFRVVEGIALWEGKPPFFDWDDAKRVTGGTYQVEFDPHDEVVASFVRIEAEGYRPAVSAAVPDSGGRFDFELVPGRGVTGTLTNPDGSAAAGATLVLALAGEQLDLIDGRTEPGSRGRPTAAGADGRFSFGPQEGPFWIVAATDRGYAIVRSEADSPEMNVRLSAWAAVDGVYRPGGKPAPGRSIRIYPQEISNPREAAPRVNWHFSAVTDDAGRFSVGLPHYGGEVMSLHVGRFDDGVEERRWLPVRLKPGETTRLDVGGSDGEGGAARRSVIGRAVPSDPADGIRDASGFVLLTRTFARPAGLWPTNVKAAAEMFEPVYRTHVEKDGSFIFPDVAPGRYQYSVSVYSNGAEARATASGKVEVSPADGGEWARGGPRPVDLGKVAYRKTTIAKIGERAPPDWGRTFDDKPIRLTDYAGRYVVVAVWDSCSGRSDKHLPHLDAVGAQFAKDDRVALLSINYDPIACGTIGLPKRPATLKSEGWVRGYLSLSEDELLSEIGGKKWPAVLIIGPDGKLLVRDLDGDAVSNKLKEFGI